MIYIINDDSNIFKIKTKGIIHNHSHGCLKDLPDWLSAKNPISHTETKAKEVNPKKIRTYINQASML